MALKKIVPTEAQEGLVLVAYLRLKGYMFTHIPNETGGTPEAKRRAIRMKQQGVSKGFPDYLVLTKNGMVAIELKRSKKSVSSPVSKEQLNWLIALSAALIPAQVCYGAEEAIKFLRSIEVDRGKT